MHTHTIHPRAQTLCPLTAGSTPGSPDAKTTPSPEFTTPDPVSPQPPTSPSAVKPKEGTSADGHAPSQQERLPSTDKAVVEPQGAAALPLPSPALVRGPKAVEQAKAEGKWPVVDVLVDKYAVLSDPSEQTCLCEVPLCMQRVVCATVCVCVWSLDVECACTSVYMSATQ